MILVGCESGKIIAFPMPADEGAEVGNLGKLLSGIETPPTARDAEGREEMLEVLVQHSPEL